MHSSVVKGTKEAIHIIYSFSIITILIGEIYYPILLLLLFFRFISLPAAFKIGLKKEQSDQFLYAHGKYYSEVSTIMAASGLTLGLIQQSTQSINIIVANLFLIISIWGIFRLFSAKKALAERKFPMPIPAGFESTK